MLWCFDDFTVRIHFLMFGTYYINSEKDRVPRLTLQFEKDYLNLYATAIRLIEEPLDGIYDWTADFCRRFGIRQRKEETESLPQTMATDALLNQEIFSGVGNIIKNEILFRIKVHPESLVGALPPKKLSELIEQASGYSYEFLDWKREGVLRKNWQVHTKKNLPAGRNEDQQGAFGRNGPANVLVRGLPKNDMDE